MISSTEREVNLRWLGGGRRDESSCGGPLSANFEVPTAIEPAANAFSTCRLLSTRMLLFLTPGRIMNGCCERRHGSKLARPREVAVSKNILVYTSCKKEQNSVQFKLTTATPSHRGAGFSAVDLARLRASTFGVHFVLWITALTLCFVASLTLPVLFITFETVAVDTPASSATFRIVTRSRG